MLRTKGLVGIKKEKKDRKTIIRREKNICRPCRVLFLLSMRTMGKSVGLGQRDGGRGGYKMSLGRQVDARSFEVK